MLVLWLRGNVSYFNIVFCVYNKKCSEHILQTLCSWICLLSQHKKGNKKKEKVTNRLFTKWGKSLSNSWLHTPPTSAPSLFSLFVLLQSSTVITAACRWVADSFLWRFPPKYQQPLASPPLSSSPLIVYVWPKMLTACCFRRCGEVSTRATEGVGCEKGETFHSPTVPSVRNNPPFVALILSHPAILWISSAANSSSFWGCFGFWG